MDGAAIEGGVRIFCMAAGAVCSSSSLLGRAIISQLVRLPCSCLCLRSNGEGSRILRGTAVEHERAISSSATASRVEPPPLLRQMHALANFKVHLRCQRHGCCERQQWPVLWCKRSSETLSEQAHTHPRRSTIGGWVSTGTQQHTHTHTPAAVGCCTGAVSSSAKMLDDETAVRDQDSQVRARTGA